MMTTRFNEQSYSIPSKNKRRKVWTTKLITKQDKVVKLIEEHIKRLETMYLNTFGSKYYEEAIKSSEYVLSLAKSGDKETLDRYHLGE